MRIKCLLREQLSVLNVNPFDGMKVVDFQISAGIRMPQCCVFGEERGRDWEMTSWPPLCSHSVWVADDFVYPKGLCQGAARAGFHHAKYEEEFHSERGGYCYLLPLGERKYSHFPRDIPK